VTVPVAVNIPNVEEVILYRDEFATFTFRFDVPPEQIEAGVAVTLVITGTGTANIEDVAVLTHPLASVPVTE
jgi:hypothetical protein